MEDSISQTLVLSLQDLGKHDKLRKLDIQKVWKVVSVTVKILVYPYSILQIVVLDYMDQQRLNSTVISQNLSSWIKALTRRVSFFVDKRPSEFNIRYLFSAHLHIHHTQNKFISVEVLLSAIKNLLQLTTCCLSIVFYISHLSWDVIYACAQY